MDAVEGLKIKDGPLVEVLNGVSLHGGLVASWPQEGCVTSAAVIDALIEFWREMPFRTADSPLADFRGVGLKLPRNWMMCQL